MDRTALSRRSLLASATALALSGLSRPDFARAEEFKMGLLVPGSIGEEGWNRIAFDALKRVEKELGAKISYVELPENPAAFEKAFRDYASQGYDVVLGHGFQFQDAALVAAEDFPDTVFLISSSSLYKGKVIGLNTDASQPFYLMGAIAATMGKGAGLIGGMEIPPISQAFEGFTTTSSVSMSPIMRRAWSRWSNRSRTATRRPRTSSSASRTRRSFRSASATTARFPCRRKFAPK